MRAASRDSVVGRRTGAVLASAVPPGARRAAARAARAGRHRAARGARARIEPRCRRAARPARRARPAARASRAAAAPSPHRRAARRRRAAARRARDRRRRSATRRAHIEQLDSTHAGSTCEYTKPAHRSNSARDRRRAIGPVSGSAPPGRARRAHQRVAPSDHRRRVTVATTDAYAAVVAARGASRSSRADERDASMTTGRTGQVMLTLLPFGLATPDGRGSVARPPGEAPCATAIRSPRSSDRTR